MTFLRLRLRGAGSLNAVSEAFSRILRMRFFEFVAH